MSDQPGPAPSRARVFSATERQALYDIIAHRRDVRNEFLPDPIAPEVLTRIRTDIIVPPRSRGPIRLRIREGDEIIEIEVANDAPLTTPARQALRAVPGVLDVVEE